MKRGEIDERRGPESVKVSIKLHGDNIFEGNSFKKPQTQISEIPYSKTRELQKAKRDIGRYKDSRAEAVSLKTEAENELQNAKNTARNLSYLLRESIAKPQENRKQNLEINSDEKYQEVMKELESAKQELRMLKLDMASMLEKKSRAEKQIEESRGKMVSCSSSLEAIKKEIEEVKDEQLVAELAHIEALRECGDIEAERAKEAIQFSRAIEQTRRKIKDLVEEVERSKDLEPKLAATLADIDVLKHELRQVKEMERRIRRGNSLKRTGASFRVVGGDELDSSLTLESVTEETISAKKELALVKEEGFQYMASMDIIRNELKHVKNEIIRYEETEKRSDLVVQSLNSKLLRAKAKLEAVSTAEERASSIVKNLSHTLEKLKIETESAKKEKDLVTQEIEAIKVETQRTETEIDSTEDKLELAMQELEEAKASEDLALENLKTRIEDTIGARTAVLKHKSSIMISKFEHEYLTGRAVGAEDLADKKVKAAKAWIDAIRANEKEITMKLECVQREMKEMRLEEEKEAFRMERSFSAKRSVERELQSWRPKREKHAISENSYKLGMHKKSIRSNGNLNSTPSRRPKFRANASPVARNAFPIKKKRQVLPNLAKLFKGKIEKNDIAGVVM